MLEKQKMMSVLENMTEDLQKNLNIILRVYKTLNHVEGDDDLSLLHLFVDEKHEEEQVFYAIKTLLSAGLDPNTTCYYHYNFIQFALYAGYSEDFILKILNESIKHGLNVNHVDDDQDSMLMTAILSDDYLGEVRNIYHLLEEHGFLTDGQTVINGMIKMQKYSEKQISEMEEELAENTNKRAEQSFFSSDILDSKHLRFPKIKKRDKKTLKDFGTFLQKKDYVTIPMVGREQERKRLLFNLAKVKTPTLIVGKKGVGKSTLLDQMGYQIRSKQIAPLFEHAKLLEVNPYLLLQGNSDSIENINSNLLEVLTLCAKYHIILYLDNIDFFYQTSNLLSLDRMVSSVMDYDIDRLHLKIVGSTTPEGYETMQKNKMQINFDVIHLTEPEEPLLREIIKHEIERQILERNIAFSEENGAREIGDILLELTQEENRLHKDNLCNPALLVQLIDLAFAEAEIAERRAMQKHFFIDAIIQSENTYTGEAMERAIQKLR